ncbi:coiled-coil domain-containing protein 24 [Strongylocentrotus purpuratus]|uniref:Coiled-coil domain-containing protein 24 n=1 Tax=Strongylocentrotus purpuratus TaxID=7668 RepID=A0A7M7PHJ2_STRPU|nr:coiled-coil domain-containing protein 24 [Strongylocentrotus purpuratus]XP_030851835.1 coiled-coil domain-containing protein 24 [Strongylocentrotus purpuratus]
MNQRCSDMEDMNANMMGAYEKPLSLWRLVEELVSPGERPDIRDILGSSLVEQSLELHEEVDNLLSIWQDYRAETEEDIPASPVNVLPEPPGMRDYLKTHIRMLLESVRERAKDEGRDVDGLLSRHNSDVLDYVSDELPGNTSPGMTLQRPGSSMSSRDGRETPMRMTPSSDSDGMSATSTVSDQVDSVKDQLNILRIDEVTNQLRSMLEDEISQLLKDTVFLQECLEDESDFRSQSRMSIVIREPSIQELKEERKKLEKEVQSAPPPTSVSVMNSVKPRSLTNSPNRRLPSPLSPTTPGSAKFRPSPPPSAGNAGRAAPVKAVHKLPTSHLPPARRASDTHLSTETNSSRTARVGTKTSIQSRTELSNKPRSPIRSLRGAGPESPTNMVPSPPSSARPPAGRSGSGGSGRLRQRVLDAKQSR